MKINNCKKCNGIGKLEERTIDSQKNSVYYLIVCNDCGDFIIPALGYCSLEQSKFWAIGSWDSKNR